MTLLVRVRKVKLLAHGKVLGATQFIKTNLDSLQSESLILNQMVVICDGLIGCASVAGS